MSIRSELEVSGLRAGWVCFAAVVLLSLLFIKPAACQYITIDIGSLRMSHFSGTVSDPSGAAISGAVVTVKNREGKEWSEKTGPNGAFSFGDLPKGDYQFKITSLGFDQLVGSLSLHWHYFWRRSINFKMTVAT